MVKYLFFIVFFFINLFYAQTDSIIAKEFNDTLYNKTNSSIPIKIISYPNTSWVERNEGIIGSFIGALLAGLVAIISVRLTARSIKKQRIEKEKEIYCGLLNAIKIELDYHHQIFPILIEGLQMIRDISLKQGEIITSKAPRNISLNFLLDIRRRLIDIELLNTNILKLISFYINKCEIVNMDMDFESLVKLNGKFKENFNFQASTKDFFDKEIEEVGNLQKSLSGINNSIDIELKTYKTAS
jgi:hypothetical protein